jgi:sterol desaturase/sphingolipid hydroxylase (fatty acid hydroxylase superfamily)
MISGNVWWLIFTAAFVLTAVLETFQPLRQLPTSMLKRWTSNWILFAISSAVLLCVYQLSGIALAVDLKASQRGALNRITLPYFLKFAIGFAAVDLVAYLSHRLFHRVGLLWRLHQVHHCECDLDLTTGFRFHPIEALIAQAFRLLAILVLGIPPAAVVFAGLAIVFEDYFSHANMRFPRAVDQALRWVIITPAMHRTHHTDVISEQNTNFATIFSFWDRIFGTYCPAHPADAPASRYGLAEVQEGSNLSALGLLALPFRRTTKQDS